MATKKEDLLEGYSLNPGNRSSLAGGRSFAYPGDNDCRMASSLTILWTKKEDRPESQSAYIGTKKEDLPEGPDRFP